MIYRVVYPNCPEQQMEKFLITSDLASGWHHVDTSKEQILEELKTNEHIKYVQFVEDEGLEIKTYENRYEKPMEKDDVMLIGFIHKYGKNGYGLWNVELEEADEKAIQEILAKYETDGYAVTGKVEELSLMDLFEME